MLDWLIIGGGLHGTALALALTQRDGVPRDRLAVVDPHAAPLAAWAHVTHNVGMAYLRSPGVHHLHYDPWSLRTFRASRRGAALDRSIPRYERPALALFNAYTAYLVERYRLDALFQRGRAQDLHRTASGWTVETDRGAIQARRVLLAPGWGDAPQVPPWAVSFHAARHIPLHHIFDADFHRDALPPAALTLVIGGGISAAQTALALADCGAVLLLHRNPLRLADFDSDPCWVGPICLRDFHTEPDFDRRRALIQAARRPGTLPADVAERLAAAERSGVLRRQQGEVISASVDGAGALALRLADGSTLRPERVILATGYPPTRPAPWLSAVIERHGLPLAACGYPVVDRTLCWADGLYVSGALAELEIGPASRNIIGARLAGERLRPVAITAQ